jgi:hypothetical protein
MDRAALLDALSKVEWGSLPQPSDNAPDAVPKALLALADATDKESAWRAYDNLLNATGNNHAGTYHPIIILAVPVLAEIVENGANWPSFAAMNTLIDLFVTFEPEPGFEVFFESSGVGHEVMPVLEEAIIGLKPLIERISADPTVEVERRAVAQELVEAIS